MLDLGSVAAVGALASILTVLIQQVFKHVQFRGARSAALDITLLARVALLEDKISDLYQQLQVSSETCDERIRKASEAYEERLVKARVEYDERIRLIEYRVLEQEHRKQEGAA